MGQVECFLACCELEMEDEQIDALEKVLTEHGFEEDPIEKVTALQELNADVNMCDRPSGMQGCVLCS